MLKMIFEWLNALLMTGVVIATIILIDPITLQNAIVGGSYLPLIIVWGLCLWCWLKIWTGKIWLAALGAVYGAIVAELQIIYRWNLYVPAGLSLVGVIWIIWLRYRESARIHTRHTSTSESGGEQ